ncbi:MAG: hypothetical protein CSA26_07765 [Desulfobacterales bacterium]|nr:MAG: hypothetical protein CSA26_07765 [Desulfobacterales bacterium]
MQIVSEKEMVTMIGDGLCFSARIDSGAFELKIESYEPVICTAIHDGHRLDPAYDRRMFVSEADRIFEEDPFTADIIEPLPIVIRVRDSRYYYDLNRSTDECIYDEAWGKKVWREPLTEVERKKVVRRHACYYRVLATLAAAVEKRFGCFLLYDLHSYNYRRLDWNTPLFDIGTHYVAGQYRSFIDFLLKKLAEIRLPGFENRAVCDEVFRGVGYQAAFLKKHYPNSLCVPLEIKKVFMDENGQKLLPDIFEMLASGMSTVLEQGGEAFKRRFLWPVE